MRFLSDTKVWIKPNKNEQFQQWLIANQDRLAASYPAGTTLYGMFVDVFGPEQGHVHILELLDSYGALDRMAAEAKNADGEYRRLNDQMDEFLDLSRGMPTSTLMKDVADATVQNVRLGAESETVPA